MTVYKALRTIRENNTVEYQCMPYDLAGALRYCGISFFKNVFISQERCQQFCHKHNHRSAPVRHNCV